MSGEQNGPNIENFAFVQFNLILFYQSIVIDEFCEICQYIVVSKIVSYYQSLVNLLFNSGDFFIHLQLCSHFAHEPKFVSIIQIYRNTGSFPESYLLVNIVQVHHLVILLIQ
jgi:hypothetical protein